MVQLFAQALKRAARNNPAWQPAKVHIIASDANGALTDAEGAFVYDLAEETFGYLDRAREAHFTVGETYRGNSVLCVITANPPNDSCLIQLGGLFYQVSAVASADTLGATVRYEVNALPELQAVTVRKPTR